VAQQLADLGLGKRINPFELTRENAREAITEVLSNQNYLKGVIEFSKKSREYNGIKNGAAMIIDFIDKNVNKLST
jgi:UDP:flavonoid glycosyltransferase YjiC (YdhE family)